MRPKSPRFALNSQAIEFIKDLKFDPNVFFLVKPCVRKHNFQGYNLVIRYSSNNECLHCRLDDKINKAEQRRQYQKEYLEKHRDKILGKKRKEEAREFLTKARRNPDKYILGNLCTNNHDFNSTGFTIRYKNSRDCVYCNKTRNAKYIEANKEDLRVTHCERAKIYYQQNKDLVNQKIKEKRKANPEIYKELDRLRHQKYNEKEKISSRKYRLTNIVKFKEYQKLRRINNKERINEYQRVYYQKRSAVDRDFYKAHRQKRKALRRNATIETVTKQDYQNIRLKFFNRCVYCNTNLKNVTEHWDHVQPISNGGKHCKSNLVPACQTCNNKKHSKSLNDWYPSQSFYSVLRHRKILVHIQDVESLKTLLNVTEQL
jgi:5-methylcytosine-specific restriction endonuclease McrA